VSSCPGPHEPLQSAHFRGLPPFRSSCLGLLFVRIPVMATIVARHTHHMLSCLRPGRSIGLSCRHARAFMSHTSQPSPTTRPASASASSAMPILPGQPPIVVPSVTVLSSDAASLQVVAKPPLPPRAERAKPKIRATKAAISIVRLLIHRNTQSSILRRLVDLCCC
jgi:hypothetical protein